MRVINTVLAKDSGSDEVGLGDLDDGTRTLDEIVDNLDFSVPDDF